MRIICPKYQIPLGHVVGLSCPTSIDHGLLKLESRQAVQRAQLAIQ